VLNAIGKQLQALANAVTSIASVGYNATLYADISTGSFYA
jgi:hypothetical protein